MLQNSGTTTNSCLEVKTGLDLAPKFLAKGHEIRREPGWLEQPFRNLGNVPLKQENYFIF